MNHDRYDDAYIKQILDETKVIAMVGASMNEMRPSYFAMKYLHEKGFRVIPVNPGHAGKTLLGETVVGRLADIEVPIDMVDIFRNSDAAAGVVDEALSLDPLPKFIWMQLSVRHDEAAATAEAAGVKVVMNRCPKIEFGRLSREIAWTGVSTGRISSKRRPALGSRS